MEKTLKKIITAGALFSFYVASTLYIHSSFLGTKFAESLVGLLYGGASVLSIAGMINIKHIIKVLGAKGAALMFATLSVAAIITLALSNNLALTAISFIVHFSSNTMVFLCIDILIDHVGKAQNFGKIRGTYLTAMNIGFMFAPLVAGFFVDRLGYTPFFIISVIFAVSMMIILSLQVKVVGFSFSESGSPWRGYLKFIKNRSLRLVYGTNFLLQFFYSWMVIYSPIILHTHLGISWDKIGLLFTIFLAVYPLLQMPIGYLTDHMFGEREFMIGGLFLMGISSLAVGFLFVPGISLLGIGIILVVSRIGASTVEVSSESYFFKKIPRDDINGVGFFRNTYPLAYILGPLIGSLLITKIPTHSVFIILGIICILGIFPLFRLRDTL